MQLMKTPSASDGPTAREFIDALHRNEADLVIIVDLHAIGAEHVETAIREELAAALDDLRHIGRHERYSVAPTARNAASDALDVVVTGIPLLSAAMRALIFSSHGSPWRNVALVPP